MDPPRWIYQKKARTQTVSEIPHIYVNRRLTASMAAPSRPPGARSRASKRWEQAPISSKATLNKAEAAPAGWSPLPHDVTWGVEKGKSGKAGNHIIRFSMNEDVAGTSASSTTAISSRSRKGLVSLPVPRRTTGSAAKVFIKCYDELPTSFRTRADGDSLKTEKTRGLSQPGELARPGRLERADRGFHASAHPVHSALGTGDALRLLAGRSRRMG